MLLKQFKTLLEIMSEMVNVPFRAISNYKRRHPRRWHRLQEKIFLSISFIFIVTFFWYASLEPQEEHEFVTDVRTFFNNIFDPPDPKPSLEPVAKKPTAHKILNPNNDSKIMINNIEEKDGKIILHGTTQ